METFATNNSILDATDYPDYGPMPRNLKIDFMESIQVYLFPVLMLVGIVGNVLSMPALYVISMRNWSTIFYLSLLSVVDLVILLVRCGDTWYSTIKHESLSQRIMNSSDALCKTYNFVFNFVLHLNPWLLVAVAVEMTIAVCWPHRLYVMCTLERAGNVVMLLVILIVCLDVNYFWTWGVPSPTYGCTYTEEFSTDFRDTIWPAMTNIVQYLSPLAVVSVCFFLTACSMISRGGRGRRRRNNRSSAAGDAGDGTNAAATAGTSSAAEDKDEEVEKQLKKYFLELSTLRDFRVVCLVLCLIFMCLTLFAVTMNLVQFLEVKGFIYVDPYDQDYFINIMLIKTVEMTLFALFYSLKIFIYAACSSTFRDLLRRGFSWVRRHLKRAFRKKVPLPKPKPSMARSQNRKYYKEDDRAITACDDGRGYNGQERPLMGDNGLGNSTTPSKQFLEGGSVMNASNASFACHDETCNNQTDNGIPVHHQGRTYMEYSHDTKV